jgi:beta-glucosidase
MTGTADPISGKITGSLEQLASLTSGSGTWTTTGIPDVLPRLVLSDGPHGLRFAGADNAGLASSVPATCFPPAVTLGCSFDPELAAEVGAAIGREARAQGVNVLLGPGLNIKRSPLGGRNFEYFSEDPYLTARMGTGLVRGIQSEGVGATVKHFAVNNQESDRMRVSAEVDERALREIYLAAFEHVLREAGPFAVMAAYNKINGVHACENPWLLTTLLRDEWGYDGLVMSDWGAVNDRVAALSAGLDLEMPPTGTDHLIVAAVRSGQVHAAVLDAACARLATLVRRTTSHREAVAADLHAHDALARRAAGESIVLLRNDGVLPLDPSAGQRIAIIGEFARTPRIQGGGSSRVAPAVVQPALDALTSGLAAIDGPGGVEFAAGFLLSGEPAPELSAAAVELAQRSDVILLFLGLPDAAESEGADRTDLSLPDVQLQLLRLLAGATAPIVVILSNGSPVDIASWLDATAAIVEAWLPGQAGGAAIADILTGQVSPSGRLTETIPLRLEDTPCYLHFPGANGVSLYGESSYVGYRYYDTLGLPVAYPFGFGLSYSTFEYADLAVAPAGAGQWTVRFTVTNTGSRAAYEVPQIYVAVDESHPSRPVHELRAFTKVFLAAGHATTVTLTLGQRDLASWDVAEHRWSVRPGRYTIQVAASSRDIRLQAVIDSPGDGHRRKLNVSSTVAEWMAEPAGEALLAPYLEGLAAWLEQAPELEQMIMQLPVLKLCTFGIGLDTEKLGRIAAEANSQPAP